MCLGAMDESQSQKYTEQLSETPLNSSTAGSPTIFLIDEADNETPFRGDISKTYGPTSSSFRAAMFAAYGTAYPPSYPASYAIAI